METRLLSALDAMESQLDALTASVVAYNPSLRAAQALLAADEDLKAAMQELCTHQNNARRLAALRADVEAAESRNRQQLSRLAGLHTALSEARLSGPKSMSKSNGSSSSNGNGTGNDAGRSVDVRMLLDVAAAQARYAAPVGYRAPELPAMQELGQEQEGKQAADTAAAPAAPNTTARSPPDPAVAVLSPDAMDEDSSFPPTQPFTDSQPGGPVDSSGNAIPMGGDGTATAPSDSQQQLASQPAANPGLQAIQYDPDGTHGDFVPWISEAMMARSHLARSQGVDLGQIVQATQQEQTQPGGDEEGTTTVAAVGDGAEGEKMSVAEGAVAATATGQAEQQPLQQAQQVPTQQQPEQQQQLSRKDSAAGAGAGDGPAFSWDDDD